MESSDQQSGFVLRFLDGPAAGEEIVMSVPPEQVRWYCESAQMGTDEPMKWWVTAEPPQPDEDVLVTEYVQVPGDAGTTEEGDRIVNFTCQPAERLGAGPEESPVVEALRRRMADMGVEKADPEAIPRATFAPADITEILLAGEWVVLPQKATMVELMIEPDPESRVKLQVGPSVMYQDDDGTFVAVPPKDVQGFRFAPSTIVGDDEIQVQQVEGEKSVRLSRARYESQAETEVIAEASRVEVVEPDGRATLVKDRQGGVDA